MHRRPKIQDVAGSSAGRMETLEDALAQMDREGPSAHSLRAVDRARATTLQPFATQAIEIPQVAKHTFHRDLTTHVGEVDRAVCFLHAVAEFNNVRFG